MNARAARNARRRVVRAMRARMREVAGRPVSWGKDDCVMFPADAQVAAGLKDPIAPVRGRWKTERGARRVLGRKGLPGAMVAAARRCGWKRTPPALAQIGDVGLCAGAHGITVVTLIHRNEWAARAEGGWAVLPTAAVRIAWSIF
jgi:hypothetical protein